MQGIFPKNLKINNLECVIDFFFFGMCLCGNHVFFYINIHYIEFLNNRKNFIKSC